MDSTIKKVVNKQVRILYIITFITLAIVAYSAYSARGEAAQTKKALCTFRLDLINRVSSGREFLREHPNGIPGISAAQITLSLKNQQLTIDSLDNLHCKS